MDDNYQSRLDQVEREIRADQEAQQADYTKGWVPVLQPTTGPSMPYQEIDGKTAVEGEPGWNPLRFPANLKDRCPLRDPKCIAEHSTSEYCVYQSTGVPVPEATEPLPAVETPAEAVPPTIQVQGPSSAKRVAYLYWPRIRGCGHKFRNAKEPNHRNCKNCWFTYFFQQKALTEHVAKIVTEYGTDPILFRYGKKFLTHFLVFAKVLAEYEHFKQTVGEEPQSEPS